ncbi:PGPGW domain-containing protein [Aliidiomarina sp. Khilg15.8]
MKEYLALAYDWIAPWVLWLTGISVLLALVTLILLPVLIVNMPSDYFLAARRRRRNDTYVRRWYLILRNVLALVLLVAGIIMLFVPGQGLLTILAAIALSDVPGKYRIERWIVLRPGILRAINWVRKRYRKPPVKCPPVGYNR